MRETVTGHSEPVKKPGIGVKKWSEENDNNSHKIISYMICMLQMTW